MRVSSWFKFRRSDDRVAPAGLTAFVHIPKTAGSTFNKVLKTYGPGRQHIEGPLSNGVSIGEIASGMSWLSGHITVNRLQSLLTGAGIDAQYYTILRNPRKQVVSHFNWLIEIYQKGEAFYSPHPAHIKLISEEIRAADHNNPKEIAFILSKHSGLFFNVQSNFVGYRGDLEPCLRRFQMVATEADLEGLFKIFGSVRPVNENVSRYHFDPAVFEHPY